jgi:hypothetical protein
MWKSDQDTHRWAVASLERPLMGVVGKTPMDRRVEEFRRITGGIGALMSLEKDHFQISGRQ